MLFGATKVALVIAGIVIVLSVFVVLIGVPYSGVSVTEQCSVGSSCVQASTYGSTFMPTPTAVIPLLAGVTVVFGLVMKRLAISWIGTIFLLGFSFIGLFSIGLFYMPLGIVLVGLLAVHSPRANIPQVR